MSLYVSVFYSSALCFNCTLHFKKLEKQRWSEQQALLSNVLDEERDREKERAWERLMYISEIKNALIFHLHILISHVKDTRVQITEIRDFISSVVLSWCHFLSFLLLQYISTWIPFFPEIFPELTALCNYQQFSLISQMRNDDMFMNRMHVASHAYRHAITSCIQKQTHF